MSAGGRIALIDACFTATSVVCVIGLTVLDTEQDFTGLFEVVSALETVGLSTGITPLSTGASKGLFIVLMFIGRLGPLVIISAWVGEVPPKPFTYPEESLPVG